MKILSELSIIVTACDNCTCTISAVASVLGNLKGVAQEMGNELDRQNKQLDRINDKTETQNANVTHINQRIRQQLK